MGTALTRRRPPPRRLSLPRLPRRHQLVLHGPVKIRGPSRNGTSQPKVGWRCTSAPDGRTTRKEERSPSQPVVGGSSRTNRGSCTPSGTSPKECIPFRRILRGPKGRSGSTTGGDCRAPDQRKGGQRKGGSMGVYRMSSPTRKRAVSFPYEPPFYILEC